VVVRVDLYLLQGLQEALDLGTVVVRAHPS
jgi:hypothetical protein